MFHTKKHYAGLFFTVLLCEIKSMHLFEHLFAQVIQFFRREMMKSRACHSMVFTKVKTEACLKQIILLYSLSQIE